LVDLGRRKRLKLRLPFVTGDRPRPGSSDRRLDPRRIEAAKQRLRREIPPRPDED
jgi:hypothetical protein